MEQFQLSTIAVVESCYKQKFAIPRQPGLAPSGKGVIRFLPEFAVPEAFEGLEQSSHIWVSFIFNGIKGVGEQTGKDDVKGSLSQSKSWSPRVRPPRLGGNKRVGVFATRSTHRPNPLGLSVVRLDSIDISAGVALHVSGIDFLDGTPVVDIKPYVPYADIVSEADNDLASESPQHLKVRFSAQAEQQISSLQTSENTDLSKLIVEVLQQDPRPAYQHEDERVYGTKLFDFDLNWRYLSAGGCANIKASSDKKDSTEIEVISLARD